MSIFSNLQDLPYAITVENNVILCKSRMQNKRSSRFDSSIKKNSDEHDTPLIRPIYTINFVRYDTAFGQNNFGQNNPQIN